MDVFRVGANIFNGNAKTLYCLLSGLLINGSFKIVTDPMTHYYIARKS